MSVIYINSYQFSTAAPALTTWDIGITTSDGNWSLRTGSTCNYDVDWGDGQTDTNVSASGFFVQSHTYASSGSYTVKIKLNSGSLKPRLDYEPNSSNIEVVSIGATPPGWSFGSDLSFSFFNTRSLSSVSSGLDVSYVTNFSTAWRDCTSLASFPLINTSSGTDFSSAWYGCSGLTSFPLINTSNGTTFASAWRNCSGLTSFPLIDTSSGGNLTGAWQNCSGLTSFPQLDMSSATALNSAWFGCAGLTSFPLLGANSATTFAFAWYNCTSLVSFPANFFNNWTATPGTSCFYFAWSGCTSLSATSVENILNSIATSGRSAPGTGSSRTITIDYNASSGTPNISSAVSTLKSRGWIIVLNGVTR